MTIQQIEQYGTQGLQAAKEYGTQGAVALYDTSKQLAYTAGTEMYNAGVYLAGRAGHYSNKKVTIQQIAVAAVIIGIIYYLYTNKDKNGGFSAASVIPSFGSKDTGGGGATPAPAAATSSFDNTPNPNQVLSKGVRSVNVRDLQNELNAAGQSLSADGIFGSKTEAALIAVTGRSSITLAEYRNIKGKGTGTSTGTGTAVTQGTPATNTGTPKPVGNFDAALVEKIKRARSNSYSNIASTFQQSIDVFMSMTDTELRKANEYFTTVGFAGSPYTNKKSIYSHYADMFYYLPNTRERWYPLKDRLLKLGLN